MRAAGQGLRRGKPAALVDSPVTRASVELPKRAERHVAVRLLGCGLADDDVADHVVVQQDRDWQEGNSDSRPGKLPATDLLNLFNLLSRRLEERRDVAVAGSKLGREILDPHAPVAGRFQFASDHFL